MQAVIQMKNEDLTSEERNLLSKCLKNKVNTKRSAIRTIYAIEYSPKYSKFKNALVEYRKKIESELCDCLS